MNQPGVIQPAAIQFQWAGEMLEALPDKALWWPRRQTLCIADVHLGKAAAFRRSGVPVPAGTTRATLARLSSLLHHLCPTRLVILGDFFHAKGGRVPELDHDISTWRSQHAALDILLIRGNHDHRAGDPHPGCSIRVADEPFSDDDDGRIVFAHHPEVSECVTEGALLCGHIHPAIVMTSAMRGLRASCFWFSDRLGILPAFGEFTGCEVVRPARNDLVFAVGDDDVIDVSARTASSRQLRS